MATFRRRHEQLKDFSKEIQKEQEIQEQREQAYCSCSHSKVVAFLHTANTPARAALGSLVLFSQRAEDLKGEKRMAVL
jgi:hypothetical protein